MLLQRVRHSYPYKLSKKITCINSWAVQHYGKSADLRFPVLAA